MKAGCWMFMLLLFEFTGARCKGGRCRSAVREADPEGQTGYVGIRVVLAAGPY
jgi:hypothetical protein